MSLRDTLRATVARCTPQQMQRATFTAGAATGHATSVQPLPAPPSASRALPATARATTVQPWPETDATRGAFTPPTSRAMQPGALTVHRLTADLIQAAMKVCDRHGDRDAARQEMREQCLALPPHLQADLLEHFRGVRRGTE